MRWLVVLGTLLGTLQGIALTSAQDAVVLSQDSNAVCSSAAWQRDAVLHKQPSDNYDIIDWSWAQRRSYIGSYVVPGAAISIAFLALPVVLLLVVLAWRLVRCICCGLSARHVLSSPYDVLTSPWTTALKVLVCVFAAGAVAMAIVGMVKMEHTPVDGLWSRVDTVTAYTTRVADSVDVLELQVAALQPLVASVNSLVQSNVNFTTTQSQVRTLGVFLDAVPSPALVARNITALNAFLTASVRSQLPALEAQLQTVLTQLLPALPPIVGVTPLLASVRAALVAYQQALLSISQSSASNPGSASSLISALRTSQSNVTLAAWRTDVLTVQAALGTFELAQNTSLIANVSAGATALAAASDTIQNRLLPPLRTALGTVNTLYVNRTDVVMAALQARIQLINTTVILLNNSVPAYALLSSGANALQGLYASTPSPIALAASLRDLQASFVRPSGLAALVSEAAQVQSAMSGTTGFDDTDAYLNNLLSGLTSFTPTVTSLATSLATYVASPTAAHFSALKSAAGSAGPVVSAARDEVDAALPDSTQAMLDEVAKIQGMTATMASPLTTQLQQVQSVSSTLSAYTSANLQALAAPLVALGATFNQLPMPRSAVLSAIQLQLSSLQKTTNTDTSAVSMEAASAQSAVSSGAKQLRSQAVDQVATRRQDYSGKADKYQKYIFPVVMGVYGLFILLTLLVAGAALLNFPAGLTITTILALVGCVVYLVLAALLGGGQVMLGDGCANTEGVIVGLVSPQSDLYPLLEYYLYNTSAPSIGATTPGIPARYSTPGLVHALAVAGYVNVTQVLNSVDRAEADMVNGLFGEYTVQPPLAAAILAVTTQLGVVRSQIAASLLLADFTPVHGLYLYVKAWACCDTGDLAYIQWIAVTTSGVLLWACCVCAGLLMWRLDRLPRVRACGCQLFSPADFLPPSDAQFAAATRPFTHAHADSAYDQNSAPGTDPDLPNGAAAKYWTDQDPTNSSLDTTSVEAPPPTAPPLYYSVSYPEQQQQQQPHHHGGASGSRGPSSGGGSLGFDGYVCSPPTRDSAYLAPQPR